MKIALAGNPNSGKTTLFNAITGKNEKVGNWSGVTVEEKVDLLSKKLSRGQEVKVIDLPGSYSLTPFTSEEVVTKDFISNESPDVIVNVIDSNNLSRGLFLTTQLLELGLPVVVAINKMDLAKKQSIIINIEKMSEVLGCQVIKTISTKIKNNGLDDLVDACYRASGSIQEAPYEDTVDIKSHQDAQQADKERFEFVGTIIEKVENRKYDYYHISTQDKIDAVVAHKWFGIPIFMVIIWGVFSLSQTYIGPYLADLFVGWIEMLSNGFIDGVLGSDINPVLAEFISEGIIGGFSAVVGFLPLIMVLFFMLALLEDSGYMARVAVVMDRFFKKIGLSGKSIIPMIIGTGCAVPGIMSTRTIKDERQRRTTIMLTPFMPCGAKLPIIALFSTVFFGNNAFVGTSMYFLAISLIIISGLIIQKISKNDNVEQYFIMELPEYRIPSIKRAFLSMLDRGKQFIIKAGTIILVCNAVVYIMQTFDWSLSVVGESAIDSSILASLSTPIAYLLVPLGFGAWQFAAASITGFIAKENVVGTLAVCFGIANFMDVDAVTNAFNITRVAGLAFLVFNLFTPPCFAAIGAMYSELESRKWLFGAIAFQIGMGYVSAFLVYQIGTLIMVGSLGDGFLPGLMGVLAICSIIGYKMYANPKEVR